MSRIQNRFKTLQQEGRKALIPFLTAGFPTKELTVSLMHAMVKGGADIIELGVPFSDPMADGPVIQRASEVALENGTSLTDIFNWVKAFRQTDGETPVVLMGYANPIERMGAEHFIREAGKAGVDGVLVVDYPPEECEEFAASSKQRGMDMIFLLAPTSTDKRMETIGRVASGYVYYVSLRGVTGAANLNTEEVAAALPRIRRHVRIPVGVGFGIRDGETARTIGSLADGVVIGSRLIQVLEAAAPAEAEAALRSFIASIRSAMDE